MMRGLIFPLVLLLPLLLAACAGALSWAPETHTVKEGDTLYSIAFRHGLDYRELAEWNDIDSNFRIYPGEELALRPGEAAGAERRTSREREDSAPVRRGDRTSEAPEREADSGESSTPSDPPRRRGDIEWKWPLEGEVIRAFGEGSMDKGIQIAADEGDPVRAAASGRVVYTGSGLIGYGKLIIVKHDDVFLSAYGHNQEILVEEGDEVDAGQEIGRVGLGRGNRSMLHFEIRSEGSAVDPMSHLPG